MLTNEIDRDINLVEEKNIASGSLTKELSIYLSPENEITEITYPVLQYPVKVKSQSFDKLNIISGKLTGIKGQYLIFSDNGYLINMEI